VVAQWSGYRVKWAGLGRRSDHRLGASSWCFFDDGRVGRVNLDSRERDASIWAMDALSWSKGCRNPTTNPTIVRPPADHRQGPFSGDGTSRHGPGASIPRHCSWSAACKWPLVLTNRPPSSACRHRRVAMPSPRASAVRGREHVAISVTILARHSWPAYRRRYGRR